MSERTWLTGDEARAGTGAVLAALRCALSGKDYGVLVGKLPDEYTGLVQAPG